MELEDIGARWSWRAEDKGSPRPTPPRCKRKGASRSSLSISTWQAKPSPTKSVAPAVTFQQNRRIQGEPKLAEVQIIRFSELQI